MKLRFTSRAAQDLAEIGDYILEQSPQAALRVRAAILESLQNLICFRMLGDHRMSRGARKLVTRRYAYLVYYMADDVAEEIVILTIQHPAREREYSDT